MNPLRKQLDCVLGHLIALLMAVMVLNVVWQVFTRFVLRAPSGYTEELSRYLMIWAGLLGAAYVAGQNGHLALDLLSGRSQGKAKRVWDRVIHAFGLLFTLLVLVVGGSRLVLIQLQLGQVSPALGINMGLVYLAVPIAGMLMAFYSLASIVSPRDESIDHQTDQAAS
jgi:TRAP-type C4-dicarboxylate transport system permease small subunit